MNKMVCGFMFSEDGLSVALIRKNRPEWQAGKYNGIGGHIEEGELYIEAIRREFEEETLLKYDGWELFTMGESSTARVGFYRAFTDSVNFVQSATDEKVKIFKLSELPDKLVPNLRWLIPLALDKSTHTTKFMWHANGAAGSM